jgi:hypothetical protein
MSSFTRNLRKGVRRLLNAKTINLDGIIVSTEAGTISKEVRNGLFKETYEEPERVLIREALRPGDRVLEIGGGIGFVRHRFRQPALREDLRRSKRPHLRSESRDGHHDSAQLRT